MTYIVPLRKCGKLKINKLMFNLDDPIRSTWIHLSQNGYLNILKKKEEGAMKSKRGSLALAAMVLVLLISGCGGGGVVIRLPTTPVPDNVVGWQATVRPRSLGTMWWAPPYNIYYDNTTPVTTLSGNKITGATSPKIFTGLTNGTTY
jgi:hypothetical protein